jgi:hypothetical protein
MAAALAVVAVFGVEPAAAQEAPPSPDKPRQIDVGFDVGSYDSDLGDFPVEAVIVRGDGMAGSPVKVEVRDDDGDVIWSGETSFTPPETRIPVNPPIAVARVGSVSLAQDLPIVEAAQIVPPQVSHAVEGGAGGSGQLALSMVLIVALVAILFRSPLPSASTQRWTR